MTQIFYGQNAELSLVSQSHGRFSLGYCESFEVEPQHTQKKLFFFNKKEGLPISILEGGAGRFGYLESEELFILGALLDKNVRAMDVINDEPAAYQEFHVVLNAKDQMGLLSMGIIAKRCRAAGNPAAMTPRDEQHGTFGFQCATRYLVKGAGIGYARITADTPAAGVTVTDEDLKFPAVGPFTVTTAHTPELINIEDALTTRLYFFVLKNGVEIKTGFTLSATGEFAVSAVSDTDVYEVFYAFKP